MRWLILALVFSSMVHAKSLEGADFPDEITVASTKLVLNGAGLRTKRKLGMNFKVYVAGLYVKAKTSDAAALINNDDTKVIELAFLRSLDKSTLQEAWTEGLDKNCKTDCEKAKEQLKQFNALMADVKDKSRMRLVFTKDTVSVEFTGGKTASSGIVTGESFRKAMFSVFVGDHPPTEELKKGLLTGLGATPST